MGLNFFSLGTPSNKFLKESKFYDHDTHMHKIEIDVSSNAPVAGRLSLTFDHASTRSDVRVPTEFSIPVDLNRLALLKRSAKEGVKTKLSISKDVCGDQFEVTYINQKPNGLFSKGGHDGKSALFYRATPILNAMTGEQRFELLPESHEALQCVRQMGNQLNHTDFSLERRAHEGEHAPPPVYGNNAGIVADEVTLGAVNAINQGQIHQYR